MMEIDKNTFDNLQKLISESATNLYSAEGVEKMTPDEKIEAVLYLMEKLKEEGKIVLI